jgi:hypothetical protein
MPQGANVLDPVDPTNASVRVSEVIAIVVVAPLPLIKVKVVPMGNAVAEFDGIVIVCPVVVI